MLSNQSVFVFNVEIILWKVAEHATQKYNCRSSGHVTQNIPFWYIDYFDLKALENSKCKEKFSYNSSYLLKGGYCKRHFIIVSPLLKSFIRQEDTRNIYYIQTDLSQTIIYLIYSSKGLFIFLKKKITCSLLKLYPLPFSLLRWYLNLNSKPPGWGTHFSLGISHVHMRYIC